MKERHCLFTYIPHSPLDKILSGDYCMKKQTLGKYVYEKRLQNNYSLRDLGDITGLSYSYIHSIEKDKVIPSREVILQLAEGLKGALPDEMLRLGGLLPENEEEKKDLRIDRELFTKRLRESIEKSGWSIDALSVKTGIDAHFIERWQKEYPYETSRDTVPNLIQLYKLANALEVTPDYLVGYTDHPEDYHPAAPRPKNLRHILATETLMFDHIPLDDKDKEKLTKIIYAVFGDTTEEEK